MWRANYNMDYINKIICGDSLKVLKEMPENIVTNVICSPPLFINKGI